MPRAWTDPLVRTKQWKRDIRFRRWNVNSLYVSGSLTAVARELAVFKLNLLGLQEAKWEKGGTVQARNYIFLWKRKGKSSTGNRIFCLTQNSISS